MSRSGDGEGEGDGARAYVSGAGLEGTNKRGTPPSTIHEPMQ